MYNNINYVEKPTFINHTMTFSCIYGVIMTKSVFNFQYEKRNKVILWIILVLFSLLAIRQVLCITELWMKPYNIIVDSCSLGISTIIAIISAFMLFNSRYVVKNNSVYVRMGLFAQRIPCGLISSVVKFKDKGYFMFYTSLNAKPSQLKINVTDEDFDGFFDAIKSYNQLISYEVVKMDK